MLHFYRIIAWAVDNDHSHTHTFTHTHAHTEATEWLAAENNSTIAVQNKTRHHSISHVQVTEADNTSTLFRIVCAFRHPAKWDPWHHTTAKQVHLLLRWSDLTALKSCLRRCSCECVTMELEILRRPFVKLQYFSLNRDHFEIQSPVWRGIKSRADLF